MQLYGQVHLLSYLDRMSCRGGSRTAAASKMERFVLIVNGWKPLTIITKRSILDVTAALDPPQAVNCYYKALHLGYCGSPRSASELVVKALNIYPVVSKRCGWWIPSMKKLLPRSCYRSKTESLKKYIRRDANDKTFEMIKSTAF